MKTIRRLYFYAVALISIEVVLWGAISLLRSMFSSDMVVDLTYTISQALSLVLVGLPIFLVHWLWAQRASASDDEERTAGIRALFLYGMLLATLIPVVQNLLALFNRLFLSAANLYATRAVVGGTQTWVDNLVAVLINLLIAAYFWNILKGEWRSLPDTESFSEIRRLYRFIWMLYGLLMVVYGAQQALSYVFALSSGDVLGAIGRETVVNAAALLLAGTPIWYFSWSILQEALQDAAEKESYLRLGILYLLSLGGVIVVLTSAGTLVYTLLSQFIGIAKPFTEFVQEIGGPVSIGVPFAVIWAYYGTWLGRQFDFDENLPRRSGKRRVYFYILSLLGLGATFFAVVSLLGLVIELLTVKGYLSNSGFGDSLAGALAFLAAGLPLWLLTWRPLQQQALEPGDMGDHARRSVIRKTYLYLVLFASVIGGMVSGGTLIFTLINSALGGEITDLLNSTLNSLQVLVLFIVLLLYHLSALRRDGASRADMLEARQQSYKLLVLDGGDGKFGEVVKAALSRRVPGIPVTVVHAGQEVPGEADAVILPGSLAVHTPPALEEWLRSFRGPRLILPDEAAGVYWLNDLGQAADAVRTLAEGQTLPPQSTSRNTSLWTTIAYVMAALFALQLIFILLTFGISLVTGF